MDLRKARALANFVTDVGEWADKMTIHEAHLREAGLAEVAHLSSKVREHLMALLLRFAEMARKE